MHALFWYCLSSTLFSVKRKIKADFDLEKTRRYTQSWACLPELYFGVWILRHNNTLDS